jgi:hypothetical protein
MAGKWEFLPKNGEKYRFEPPFLAMMGNDDDFWWQ